MAWDQMFYSPVKKAMFMFDDDILVQCPDTEFIDFLEGIWNPAVDLAKLTQYVTTGTRVDANGTTLVPGDAKRCRAGIYRDFIIMLKRKRQRNSVNYSVDIFGDRARMQINKSDVDIRLTHRPFVISDRPPQKLVDDVYDDYLVDHFPYFDRFIENIAAARFAGNARKAYSWLHAESSWGKTFLMHGVLGDDELGIVTDVTIAEVEKIFSGSPIGKSQEDFIHSWITFVDEVRYISGDIKQLDKTISGSPKHQLSFKTRVYSKIFCSAYGMDSFGGDTGVDAQLANRFNYIRPPAVELEDRPLFIRLGSTMYRKALAAWTADYLNAFVAKMRAMGPKAAADHCDELLMEYHDTYRADLHLGSMGDTLDEYAEEIQDLMVQMSVGPAMARAAWPKQLQEAWADDRFVTGYHHQYGNVVIMKSPAKLIKAWLVNQVDGSEKGGVRAEASKVAVLVSSDGMGCKNHKIRNAKGHEILAKGIIFSVLNFM